MEDYNPFAGTSAVDFNEVDKKAKEAAAQDQSQSASTPAAKSPAAADYSPFASQSNPFSTSASSPGSVTTPGGAQFGLASPPTQAAPAPPAYSPPPAYGAPSAPSMAPMGGGPVGLDGQPLPGASAPAYGAPPASPYGAPPPYGGAPQYGAPQQQQYGSAPQYGAPPQQYGGAPQYGAPQPGAYGAPQGAWPPQPANGMQYAPAASYGRPPQLDNLKWNWGAFLLPFFWSIAHSQWKVVRYMAVGIVFMVIFGSFNNPLRYLIWFGIAVYLGFKGHELAWNNRSFDSFEHYVKVQRAWLVAGLLIGAPGLLGGIVFEVIALAGMGHQSSMSAPTFGGAGSSGDSGASDNAPTDSTPSAGGSGGGASASSPASGGGADAGSAGAYGIGGDSGSDGASGPSMGFHPKD